MPTLLSCICVACLLISLACSSLLPPAEVNDVMAVSTYSNWSTAKCPGATDSALNPSLTQDSFNRLNWLLNNFYSPLTRGPTICVLNQTIAQNQYFAHFDQRATPPGTYNITGLDMQAAVWTLTGGLGIVTVLLLCALSAC
jgi:hypothetical protein